MASALPEIINNPSELISEVEVSSVVPLDFSYTLDSRKFLWLESSGSNHFLIANPSEFPGKVNWLKEKLLELQSKPEEKSSIFGRLTKLVKSESKFILDDKNESQIRIEIPKEIFAEIKEAFDSVLRPSDGGCMLDADIEDLGNILFYLNEGKEDKIRKICDQIRARKAIRVQNDQERLEAEKSKIILKNGTEEFLILETVDKKTLLSIAPHFFPKSEELDIQWLVEKLKPKGMFAGIIDLSGLKVDPKNSDRLTASISKELEVKLRDFLMKVQNCDDHLALEKNIRKLGDVLILLNDNKLKRLSDFLDSENSELKIVETPIIQSPKTSTPPDTLSKISSFFSGKTPNEESFGFQFNYLDKDHKLLKIQVLNQDECVAIGLDEETVGQSLKNIKTAKSRGAGAEYLKDLSTLENNVYYLVVSRSTSGEIADLNRFFSVMVALKSKIGKSDGFLRFAADFFLIAKIENWNERNSVLTYFIKNLCPEIEKILEKLDKTVSRGDETFIYQKDAAARGIIDILDNFKLQNEKKLGGQNQYIDTISHGSKSSSRKNRESRAKKNAPHIQSIHIEAPLSEEQPQDPAPNIDLAAVTGADIKVDNMDLKTEAIPLKPEEPIAEKPQIREIFSDTENPAIITEPNTTQIVLDATENPLRLHIISDYQTIQTAITLPHSTAQKVRLYTIEEVPDSDTELPHSRTLDNFDTISSDTSDTSDTSDDDEEEALLSHNYPQQRETLIELLPGKTPSTDEKTNPEARPNTLINPAPPTNPAPEATKALGVDEEIPKISELNNLIIPQESSEVNPSLAGARPNELLIRILPHAIELTSSGFSFISGSGSEEQLESRSFHLGGGSLFICSKDFSLVELFKNFDGITAQDDNGALTISENSDHNKNVANIAKITAFILANKKIFFENKRPEKMTRAQKIMGIILGSISGIAFIIHFSVSQSCSIGSGILAPANIVHQNPFHLVISILMTLSIFALVAYLVSLPLIIILRFNSRSSILDFSNDPPKELGLYLTSKYDAPLLDISRGVAGTNGATKKKIVGASFIVFSLVCLTLTSLSFVRAFNAAAWNSIEKHMKSLEKFFDFLGHFLGRASTNEGLAQAAFLMLFLVLPAMLLSIGVILVQVGFIQQNSINKLVNPKAPTIVNPSDIKRARHNIELVNPIQNADHQITKLTVNDVWAELVPNNIPDLPQFPTFRFIES